MASIHKINQREDGGWYPFVAGDPQKVSSTPKS